jgi:DNA (cytosine-5)-methyltransferase 1
MNHIGLFEGIGGFSLAARWMGWKTIAWCEWNEFGQKVLKHHFPKAQPHGDITKTDFTIYRGQCDIVTGGFPCQPYSLAGKRKGKADERHLWPEMLRAIREIQPTWVVGENVFGLVNWDGGLVFNEVQADLEAQGYEVFPYVLPAVSVNAPHRRDRIWFVAYSNRFIRGKGGDAKPTEQPRYRESILPITAERTTTNPDCSTARASGKSGGIESIGSRNNDEQKLWGEQTELNIRSHELLRDAPNTNITPTEHSIQTRRNLSTSSLQQDATDTNSERQQEFNNAGQPGKQIRQPYKEVSSPQDWSNFPTQSPICSGDDGISTRLDSITFPKWRNESIKAAGNAIVPQVAYQIFKTIKLYNEKL